MPSPSSDWQVYEEQLGNLGYGKPLWQPEYPEGGARIGDVGFVRGGRFQALWNVVDPRPSDPMSPPEGFVKLKYNKALLEQTNPEFLAPIPYVSNNVTYKKIDTNAGAVVYVVNPFSLVDPRLNHSNSLQWSGRSWCWLQLPM